jgi:vacuolar-type H+-ATPase subunit H
MSREEVSRSVETIEVEAEKMLATSRARASEIILKAKEEAGKILSSQLPTDEVKTECDNIIHRAKEEAGKKIQDSVEKASAIRTDVDKKMEGIVERLASIITGANSK